MQTDGDGRFTARTEDVRAHVKKQLLRLVALRKKPHSDAEITAAKSEAAFETLSSGGWVPDPQYPEILEALPVAVYTTDAEGRITFFNEAAAALWGRRPVLGQDRWCGSWRIYTPDGTPLPHDHCPMAVALRENRPVRNVDAIAERPDGTRVRFMPYPTPLRDASGGLIGAVNILVDIGSLQSTDAPR